MKRALTTCLLATAAIGLHPSSVAADVTALWGFSRTPSARPTRGFAVGLSLIVVGFEFEYANTSEDLTGQAPGLRTGMINGLIQTPTRTQFYLTAGGGFFRESLGGHSETHIGTNIGGGVKIGLAGPVRLRLDYRVFSLRGQPLHRNPQRFYAGVNLAF